MKPRVCLFSDSLAPSGVGRHMLTLAGELSEDFALSLVCPPSPGGQRLLDQAYAMGLDVLPLEVRGSAQAAEQLSQWLRTEDVQVFHAHAGVAWEGHDGTPAARAADVPAVVRTEHLADLTSAFTVGELPDLVYSPYHRDDARPEIGELTTMVEANRAEHLRRIELVDLVICVSAGVRDSFVTSGVPVAKLRVVPNGIPPSSAGSASRARERLGLPDSARIVLTVGRMIDVKGHHYLLSAAPMILERQPEARFVWVGQGPLQAELRERVAALGLEESVCFAGPRSDVPDLMAAADLLVLPSLVEGLPLVVLEAMAAGIPVVGTRVIGTSEAIVDGVTGRLVPPGRLAGPADASELADATIQVLDNPRLAAGWGAAGRDLVQRDFTAARMAADTAKVYRELL
jgi:glycosyltransferase involved in cell wall biosynthesis